MEIADKFAGIHMINSILNAHIVESPYVAAGFKRQDKNSKNDHASLQSVGLFLHVDKPFVSKKSHTMEMYEL